MKLVLALGLVLAGCYSPHYKDCEIGCATGSCPSGLSCIAGQCRTDPHATNVCGVLGDGDGGIDGNNVGPDATVSQWAAPFTIMDGMQGDRSPTLRDDLLEMYFVRNNDLFFANRTPTMAMFGSPTTDFNLSVTANVEEGPDLSPTGDQIYYASNGRIFSSSRSGSGFGNGIAVAGLDNGPDADPSVSRDRSRMIYERTQDAIALWTSDFQASSNSWLQPTALQETASWSLHPHSPMYSTDMLTLYFHAQVGTQMDLFEAHRASLMVPFDAPVPLSTINQANRDEVDPWISEDGNTLVFVRITNGVPQFLQATRLP